MGPTTQEAVLKLVPEEPTPEMIEAAVQAASFYVHTYEDGHTPVEPVSAIIFRAMIAAAPTPEPMQADLRERVIEAIGDAMKSAGLDTIGNPGNAAFVAAVDAVLAILAAMQAKSEPWGRDISEAPRDGTVILGRCGDFAPFECQWDGERFIHFDPDDGPIAYKPDRWKPLNVCKSCGGFGFLDHPSPSAPNPDLEGLVEARAWAEKTLRRTLLDDPDDDRHLRTFLAATAFLK